MAWCELGAVAYSAANLLNTWFIMLQGTGFAAPVGVKLPWNVLVGENLFAQELCGRHNQSLRHAWWSHRVHQPLDQTTWSQTNAHQFLV